MIYFKLEQFSNKVSFNFDSSELVSNLYNNISTPILNSVVNNFKENLILFPPHSNYGLLNKPN